MTAETDLLHCAECGMPCEPGEYHPFAACLMFKASRNSTVVRANLRSVQRHATDARDAEIEALRAEVERLRAIAGCAYQMAGVHDAPEVWLDRLGQAANGDALPDPDTISDELLPYQPDAVCEAEARAERLAEALQLALDSHGVTLLTDPPQDAWKARGVEAKARAALRDHDQEDRND